MTLAVCGFVLTAVMLDFSDGLLCVFSLTEGVTTMVKRSEQWSKPLLVDDDWGIVLSNIIQYHPIFSISIQYHHPTYSGISIVHCGNLCFPESISTSKIPIAMAICLVLRTGSPSRVSPTTGCAECCISRVCADLKMRPVGVCGCVYAHQQ